MCQDCVRTCQRPNPLSWVAGAIRLMILAFTIVTVAALLEYWHLNSKGKVYII